MLGNRKRWGKNPRLITVELAPTLDPKRQGQRVVSKAWTEKIV